MQAAYDNIWQENNVKGKTCSRKTITKLIQAEMEDVEFHKPKRVNEPERVSIKESRDVAIQLSETVNEECASNMETLYDAAVRLTTIEFVKGIPCDLENESFFYVNTRHFMVIDGQMDDVRGDKYIVNLLTRGSHRHNLSS